jgi:hypothetical protein
MPVDLGWIQAVELRSAEQPEAAVPTYQNSEKKPGPLIWSRLVLAGCPDKLEFLFSSFRFLVASGLRSCSHLLLTRNSKLQLRAAPRPYRQVSHLSQDTRHLHPI